MKGEITTAAKIQMSIKDYCEHIHKQNRQRRRNVEVYVLITFQN